LCALLVAQFNQQLGHGAAGDLVCGASHARGLGRLRFACFDDEPRLDWCEHLRK
jgi:hypothetical protein